MAYAYLFILVWFLYGRTAGTVLYSSSLLLPSCTVPTVYQCQFYGNDDIARRFHLQKGYYNRCHQLSIGFRGKCLKQKLFLWVSLVKQGYTKKNLLPVFSARRYLKTQVLINFLASVHLQLKDEIISKLFPFDGFPKKYLVNE